MVILKIQNPQNKFKNYKILILSKLVLEDIIHSLCHFIMIYFHGVVDSMENVDKDNFKKILSRLKSSYH